MQGHRCGPKNKWEGGNAGVTGKQKAGKCYHVTYRDWQKYFMRLNLINQLCPRHQPSLTPLWMTVCWFCSLLFTLVEFAHQRKNSTQKCSRWTGIEKRIRKQRKNVRERKIRLIYAGICWICQRICGGYQEKNLLIEDTKRRRIC